MLALANNRQVAQTLGADLLLSGQGAGPLGDRPFLDKLSLETLSVQRLFQSAEGVRAARGAARGSSALTQHDTEHEPPNPGAARERQGHAADADQGSDAAVEGRAARAGELQAQRRCGAFVWMYLPPDQREGEKRPALVWAYPLEFNDASDPWGN